MNKRNIYLLYAIALLQGMVFYAPVATLYRQAEGLDIFEISVIESISLALTIALEIPWGWMADRIGYRRSMVLCSGLYFVSKLVFWQARSFGGFLLERILLSVVCAGLSGLDSSLLYLSCGKKNAHRVFSIYQNLGETGMLAAAGIFALCIGENYRMAAAATAFSYGVAAILAWGLQEVKPEKRQGKPRKLLLTQLKNKKLLYLVFAAGMLGQTHQSITVFLNQLQYDAVGMDHTEISAAFIAVSIAGLAGGFSARLGERMGVKPMGSTLLLLGMISCLTLAGTEKTWLSVAAVLLLRGCFSLFAPLYQQLQNQAVTTADRATALSMNAVVHDGLGIFLSLIFGRIAQWKLDGAFAFGAILCLTGLALFQRSR